MKKYYWPSLEIPLHFSPGERIDWLKLVTAANDLKEFRNSVSQTEQIIDGKKSREVAVTYLFDDGIPPADFENNVREHFKTAGFGCNLVDRKKDSSPPAKDNRLKIPMYFPKDEETKYYNIVNALETLKDTPLYSAAPASPQKIGGKEIRQIMLTFDVPEDRRAVAEHTIKATLRNAGFADNLDIAKIAKSLS